MDRNVIHSLIPADVLARLGIVPDWPRSSGYWTPEGTFVDLPRGAAQARLDIPTDGSEFYREDLCATIPVLFAPAGSQPVLGRTTLSFMDLDVDPDNDRLIPAEIRIPGDVMAELMIANGWRPPADKEDYGTV